MEKATLDVLVTFYNQEKYVDRTLTSIFSQKCNFQFNVLIGDDGSSDQTVEIANKWKEKYPDRIEIYFNSRERDQKYIGGFRASQNRLNLIKKVVSDYFVFLDGDDYYTDIHKFQKQIDILENLENKDCIGCSHQIEATYRDGSKSLYEGQPEKEGKYSLSNYWSRFYFHTDTIIFRSEIIKKLDFKLLENNFNDNMITFSMMLNGKVYYLPIPMAAYDQTGEGIWTGEKVVISNLRNMFLFDLCNKMAPRFWRQTCIRFSSSWKNLYLNRNKIHRNELMQFYNESVEKKLFWSRCWINYNENHSGNRILVALNYSFIRLNSIIYKIQRYLLQKL